jgi:hypothetical protein
LGVRKQKLRNWHDRSYQLIEIPGLEPFAELKNTDEKKPAITGRFFMTAV